MTQSCPPQPQVSVIVPVYNQERYLEECISSIRRQTLAEWECLIINDGSSDSSGEIARRFSEADSRIRYFEQENGGVSSARNLGMRHASGRYLCFVDGDDFIDAAFLKHLLDASDRGASDLTVAGKLFCDRFPPDKIPALPTCGIFLRREFPLKNNLEFPEGIQPCEDGLFSHFALALAEKISFCPEAVYHYRQHEQGNHHQIRKRTADILPMIPRWLSLIEEFYEQRHLWKRKAGHLVRFIRAAAAPYLGFADPDDYVEPDMYERLYRLAEESGADMVQCSYSPFLPAESGESRGMAEEKLLHIENTACDGVFTEKGEIFRLFLEDRITGVVWSKLFRRLLPGCSAPLEVRLPSSFTSGEDTLYVSRAIARCRSVALTSEKLYHYGLGGPQSVSSRNRKAETRPASYYAVFEMLTREKLREGVLGSNRTAYMNYIVPLLFPDNEMPAGRLRHWAELWREADITSEHVCGMPREQRAYLEAALAGRWIYLRLLQCFWKFKTARRKMFRLRFSKNGIDTLQILGYTLYSAKKFPRSSL